MRRITEALNRAETRGGQDGEQQELLAAAGLAGLRNPLGQALQRALCSLEPRDVARVADIMLDLLAPTPGLLPAERRVVVTAAVRVFLNPACPACCGRGFGLIPNTRKLGETPCPVCSGTGKIVLLLPDEAGRLASAAAARMDRALSKYESNVSRKLGLGLG